MKRVTSVHRNYGEHLSFTLDENSTFEDFGDAVLVCAFIKTGKFGNPTEDQREDAGDLGPRLLNEANKRFGPDAASRITVAIALTVAQVQALINEGRNRQDKSVMDLYGEERG